jgi:hypothetical protein
MSASVVVGAKASGITKSVSTCRDNRSVLYVPAPKLFDDLALAIAPDDLR